MTDKYTDMTAEQHKEWVDRVVHIDTSKLSDKMIKPDQAFEDALRYQAAQDYLSTYSDETIQGSEWIDGDESQKTLEEWVKNQEEDMIDNLWEPEFSDILRVFEMGAKKHGRYNWLDVDGGKSSLKDMHASMFRHLAASSSGDLYDKETGLHHLLHLASRALMLYTRHSRGIIHSDDLTGEEYRRREVALRAAFGGGGGSTGNEPETWEVI